MTKQDFSKEVILKIISNRPDIGKTAVMKMMFILQESYGLPLGHTFDIYTYGPYASSVTAELEHLIYTGFVDAVTYDYKNASAYKLNASQKGKDAVGAFSMDVESDDQKIRKVLDLFGSKNAKELELDSTIIYIKHQYAKDSWPASENDISEIINEVHSIKPHFTKHEIQNSYFSLKEVLC